MGEGLIKQEIYDTIKKHVSEKRWHHTLGVVSEAIRLAGRYGVSEEKAEIAAFFHDFCRNFPVGILNGYIKNMGLEDYYLDNVSLAHGKVAAEIMASDYAISDQDVLNAVSYHTTGRAGMSSLEKVLFVADAIEPEREYTGVDVMRKLADTDLDRTCLYGLEKSLSFVKATGAYIHPDTIGALEYLKNKSEVKNKQEEYMNNKELALKAAEVLDNKKAQDILVIDIAKISGFADYFVIASGGSERQVKSLSEEVEDKLNEAGALTRSIEGKNGSGWILMDFGDVIVNIFTIEQRERYNIERIWGDGEIITA